MASTNTAPLYQKGISKNIGITLATTDPEWRRIFHVEFTSDRYIWHQDWIGYQLPQQRVYGGAIEQGNFATNYSKQFVMRSFGLGDTVPMEDIKDDLYSVFNKVLARKGSLMAITFDDLIQYDTANWFAFQGFASGNQVVGSPDGVALFSTQHPQSAQVRGTFQANAPSVAGDLSVATAKAMITNLENQKAPNGLTFLRNRAKCVVVNPVNQFIAEQVFHGKPYEQGSADYNDSTHMRKKGIEIITWPYYQGHGSTGTNNSFFMVGETHNLYFYMRDSYDVDTDFDINTNSQVVIALTRYDYGESSWRGTSGNPGL